MIKTVDLFTVPLFKTEYPKANELNKTLTPIFKEIEKNDEAPFLYGISGYTSYGKGNVLKEIPECIDLYYWIRNIVLNIQEETKLTSKIDINDSWFSINRKYSSHEEHHHIPATWSGVYYVNAQEDDANITFVNENLSSNWPYTRVSEFNDYNTREKTFSVKTGCLYVFPGYLKHKVETQIKDNERMSIAFNASHFSGELR